MASELSRNNMSSTFCKKKYVYSLIESLRHVELHLSMMDDVINFSSSLEENVKHCEPSETCLHKFQYDYSEYSKNILVVKREGNVEYFLTFFLPSA